MVPKELSVFGFWITSRERMMLHIFVFEKQGATQYLLAQKDPNRLNSAEKGLFVILIIGSRGKSDELD